jgi:hypothetical protein
LDAAMLEYRSTVSIQATPEAVWAIVTDGPGYAMWNPEINRVDGTIALGQKIKAHVVLHGGKVQPVSVKVIEFDPLRRMVWRGGMPFGLFTGLRSFILTPRDGAVEFTMHIKFSGLCAKPIAKSLGDRQPDIDAFCAGLKTWAEQVSAKEDAPP